MYILKQLEFKKNLKEQKILIILLLCRIGKGKLATRFFTVSVCWEGRDLTFTTTKIVISAPLVGTGRMLTKFRCVHIFL